MAVNAIECSELSRHYQRGGRVVTAVDRVSLRVTEGALLAVTGASGSGKTTLLNLIGGLDSPTGGTLDVYGQQLQQLSERQLSCYRRERVGVVFQAFRLLPERTALENVELPLTIAEVPRNLRRDRATAALTSVGLAQRLHHRPSELSGGEQQLVGIARALAKGPRLLLADEPTGNLDSAASQELMQLLKELQEHRGLTVILVTHDVETVRPFATEVVAMQDGRLNQ